MTPQEETVSLQRTKEQERAAAAWDDVSKCLEQAIWGLQQQIESAKRRIERDSTDHESHEKLKNFEEQLQNLQNPKRGKEWQNSYAGHVKKFPMLVLNNGLGATLAFLRAKGKNFPSVEEEVLYRQISRWVTAQIWGGEGNTNLLAKLIDRTSGSDTYRRATVEAFAFATWLKRFAEAILEAEPDVTATTPDVDLALPNGEEGNEPDTPT